MSTTFCTIITRSHLHWALALHASLERHQPGTSFTILVTDADALVLPPGLDQRIKVMTLEDVLDTELGRAIQTAYADRPDELRWSLKPILMMKLLEQYEKVLYGDCDLHFFAPIDMLLEQLDRDRMLLSPHWRCSRPSVHRTEFIGLMTEGFFNGGFVAANRQALEPLEHWARNCLAMCVVDRCSAQFVDQSHLNVLPVYYEGIGIIRHRGCNLAFWNRIENVRGLDEQGEVKINGSYPVVFIHFTKSTVRSIGIGQDPLLQPYLDQFSVELERYGTGQNHVQRVLDEHYAQLSALAEEERKRSHPSLLQRIRTRLRHS